MSGEIKNINLALPKDLHQELRVAAFQDERSQTAILREALEQWLARRAEKATKEESS